MKSKESANTKFLECISEINRILLYHAPERSSTWTLLLTKLQSFIDADYCCLFLERSGKLYLAESTMYDRTNLASMKPAAIVERAFFEKNLIYIKDSINFGSSDVPNVRSQLAVPLIKNNSTVGVFDLGSHVIDKFANVDHKQLQFLISQLAIAIKLKQLFEENSLKTFENAVQKRIVEMATVIRAGYVHYVGNRIGYIRVSLLNILAMYSLETAVADSLTELVESSEKVLESGSDFDLFFENLAKSKQQEVDYQKVKLSILSNKELIKGKDVHIKFGNFESLPTFQVDSVILVEVIISELIRNAVDAMPSGGMITISGNRQGKFIEIIVQDTGVGISRNHLEKIFDERFTTREGYTHKGIGLHVIKTVVEFYSGYVKAESNLGRGTAITVAFPIHVE